MPAETTLAFVIQTRDYRDTSLMVTLFTYAFGKIKAIVKGGRDARYRLGSTLEPFSLNEVVVYRRKRSDLHLVTAAELINRYDDLRRDLDRLGQAAYFMELVDQLVGAEEQPDVFRLIEDAFEFMRLGNSAKRAARIFEIKLMNYLGLMPELGQCIRCETKDPMVFFFSVKSGGIVCSQCRTGEGPLLIVPKGSIQFLEHAKRKPFDQMQSIKVSREVGEKLEQMMRQFLDHHLSYRPKSLSFLEKLHR